MIPEDFRLFNIFPTPYYDYYNKFNIKNRISPNIQRETIIDPVKNQLS